MMQMQLADQTAPLKALVFIMDTHMVHNHKEKMLIIELLKQSINYRFCVLAFKCMRALFYNVK